MERASRALRAAALALSGWYLAEYFFVALFRMRFPYGLQVAEEFSLDLVIRMLAGQSLYAEPSLDFVGPIYTPLYYYLSALLAKSFGIGFLPLRMISFVASLGSLYFIHATVRRETRSDTAAMIAAGLFSGIYTICQKWYDLARVDSLFLFFLLAGIYVLRFHASVRGYGIAAVLFWLAYFTKQTALIIVLPLLVGAARLDKRSLAFLSLPFAALLAGSTWLMDRVYGGWYSYYVMQLPSQHALNLSAVSHFWTGNILWSLSIASAVGLYYLSQSSAQSSADSRQLSFYRWAAVGMLGGAWASKMFLGSYVNVVLPAYAAIAILFGLGVGCLAQILPRALPLVGRPAAEFFLYLLCTAQLLTLWSNPIDHLPQRETLREAQALKHTIARTKGDVFAPFHPYLAFLAGKKGHASGDWIWEVMRGHEGAAKTRLSQELREAFEKRQFDAVLLPTEKFYYKKSILGNNCCWWNDSGVDDHYRKDAMYFFDRRSPFGQREVAMYGKRD